MKCSLPIELLSGYLDGELNKKQEAELKKHLKKCQRCRNELEELRQLDQYVKTLEIEEPSREFFFALNRRVMQKIKKKSKFFFFRFSQILVPVAVAALVLIVLVNIHQPTRLVSLNDRILYAEIEKTEDLDLQIPELGVVQKVLEEKEVAVVKKRTHVLSAAKREDIEEAEPAEVKDEVVGVLSIEALQIPQDKVVRAIVDSTGKIVKVATGNTIIPEKDTMLENRLQGQQLSPPTVAGRRAQLYIDFTQKQEKKN